MRGKVRRTGQKILTSVLLVVLVALFVSQMMLGVSGNERFFSGSAEDYYQSLLQKGFPTDYATALTELYLLHPNWDFTPLRVTEIDPLFTWNYVIEQETRDEDTNLVSKQDTYSAYWHESNRNEPETGSYQPSQSAVEYFMDPRNYLNEADIFQFYDLSAGTHAPQEAVQAVLNGTFMESALLENGKSYAAYFCEIGRELQVNPVYLAVKVRQEQGVNGTSPVISGACGTKLNEFYQNQTQYTDTGKAVKPPANGFTAEQLLALNQLYNYYNIKASGAGVFDIYYNAMTRALSGTESMKDVWGGSAAWNTRWKALYGGAYFLKSSYIDRYQPTIYLQKFNVDSRSGRAFWGQYMQSVFGAVNEGRILYQSFAAIEALDSECHFLIPVYDGIPQNPCADPANGACANTAKAIDRYSFQNEVTLPSRKSATKQAVYLEQELYYHTTLKFKGVFTHDYGIDRLEYSWDHQNWQQLSSGTVADVALSTADFSENTSHILVIRGKADYNNEMPSRKSNSYFLCAVIYVQILPPKSVTLSYEVANTVSSQEVLIGSSVTLPASDSQDFAGWMGSDGSFLPSGATVEIADDIRYSALFLGFEQLEGAALYLSEQEPHIRFSAIMQKDAYQKLTDLSPELIQISACLENESVLSSKTLLTLQKDPVKSWVCFDMDTPVIPPDSFENAYSAVFYADLFYTDGTQRTITASGPSFSRSAKQIATLVLEKGKADYTETELVFLQSVAGQK